MFTNNYRMTIDDPRNGDEVEARVAFSYYAGYKGDIDSPPEPAEVELVSCYIDGVDVTPFFTASEIEHLEDTIMCSECDEYDAPDDENYIDTGDFLNYN